MHQYAAHVSTRQTPQSEPVPGKTLVPNSAGGYTFAITPWQRLDRFLILGAEGGTYYATERQLTIENAVCVNECLALDPARTVSAIVSVSEQGLAAKNDPAILALAIAASFKPSALARRLAMDALPKVCRIGTHLFQFNEFVKGMRGRGRALNRGISNWYLSMPAGRLAYQMAKYQQRNGWSHRDLLRLSKPRPAWGSTHQQLFHWATKGWEGVGVEPHPNQDLQLIWALERAKHATEDEVCKLILDYNLPRECVPTQHLNSVEVWEALLQKMPLHALVRNLGKMTNVGLLGPMTRGVSKVCEFLSDEERIVKSRLHPVSLLTALLQYRIGRGDKGSLTWHPVPQVVDALDAAFYKAFKAVQPTKQNWLLALDVSGSMGSGSVGGSPNLTPRLASAAMALVTAAVEPNHHLVAFTAGGKCVRPSMHHGYPSGINPLAISPRMRLTEVVDHMSRLDFGGTDCALPMVYAKEAKLPVDVFCIYTDCETWAGNIHPFQALEQYRQSMGRPAKLAVIALTSTGFSLANPEDPGMLDVVGFSTDTPQALNQFAIM